MANGDAAGDRARVEIHNSRDRLGLGEAEASALAVGNNRYARVSDGLERAVPDRAPSRLTRRARHFGPLGNSVSEAWSLGLPVGSPCAASSAIAAERGFHFLTGLLRLFIVPKKVCRLPLEVNVTRWDFSWPWRNPCPASSARPASSHAAFF